MKRKLVSLLERVRATLNDAIDLIEKGDIDGAVEKLDHIATRLREKADELGRAA